MRARVQTASLGRWVDPADAFTAICGDSDAAFWLDSGPSATSGHSYLGVASRVTTDFGGPVLDWVRAALGEGADVSAASPGFSLGLVGWLGYEVRGETMAVPVERTSRYPDAAFLTVERTLAFDHAAHTVTLLALDDVDEYRDQVIAALAVPVADRAVPAPQPATAVWAYSDSEYLDMIRACQAAIVEGDAYQLCLTTEVSVDVAPDPVATYLALRASSPTHHGALLRAGAVSLLSASPEQFLSVSADGIVSTSPSRARDLEVKRRPAIGVCAISSNAARRSEPKIS